ncbi:oligopeptide transporter 4-like [Macadamia integrifolia]|uniref:oligopeptide transporter 4-like n=1 Tax=Macadamia integrifolia TaxID=60698 RepID=UPI001C4EED66|nr:oligopeptide transporter 4-like [Macadamia integrifolia]
MGSVFEVDTPGTATATNKKMVKEEEVEEEKIDEEELSPIEQVRLTVTNTDDPTLPVWTFRMWTLGIISCCLLSFLNQFFSYRTEPLIITQITVQVATLPIGRFMASVLPKTKFCIPGFGSREFSFNPGPFNTKEHVLITIFANAGCAFGIGTAYAVGIVNIIKAFYHRNISFIAGWILIITTQVCFSLSTTLKFKELLWALHEKEERRNSRAKFFLIAFICSFCWYAIPGYLFPTLTSISWVCWAFKNSVTAQQIGSGLQGLGLGAFTLDWSAVASFLFSPLISPFFAIVNIFFGYALIVYIAMPIAYWGVNLYGAKKFPIFSSQLFTSDGQTYNISAIVNNNFELDIPSYKNEGQIHLSMFFALTYGFGFATIAATLTHVGFFYGREIYDRFRASYSGKIDIHTRLMKKYEDIPQWWFYVLLLLSVVVSLVLCTVLNNQVQMPWWGLLFACALAFLFTLPVSVITATTNQTPGLNIITEYLMGVILPGRPIANVCFKTYGYMSMGQAVSFLSDFKLGHYMKIPPRSMFLVQFIGTIIAGTINIGVAWWLLDSINDICQIDLLSPNSPWTCPNDRVFFDASVIWGLVGPLRIFGSQGAYGALNWFFLGGAIGPILVWLLHKAFPRQTWIPLINLPVLLGATAYMPPATALNYNSWIVVGTIFNFFVFRYRKQWWQRYNYVLSAALDAGVAFMAVLLYFTLTMESKSINWWGTAGEHCDLASCPTAKGIVVDGCPVF